MKFLFLTFLLILNSNVTHQGSKEIYYNAIKNHRNINLINAKTCGPISSERIINGENAKVREFRWAALLGLQSAGQINWSCGGTLISQRYVLTVCHCVSTDLVKVRLGEHTISSKIDCDDSDQCADPVQDIDIERKIKHPHFKRSTRENDIALVRLARPADLTKNNVKTICLPTNPKSDIEEFQKLGLNLTVTGWGLTQGGKPSDILQRALVPYIDFNKCNAIFNSDGLKVYPTQLCAGYSKNSGHSKTDSCKGDSGGGLIGNFLYNEYPKAILYGVVVGGVNCLDPTKIYPGIYTNVKYFLTWILDNMDE